MSNTMNNNFGIFLQEPFSRGVCMCIKRKVIISKFDLRPIHLEYYFQNAQKHSLRKW